MIEQNLFSTQNACTIETAAIFGNSYFEDKKADRRSSCREVIVIFLKNLLYPVCEQFGRAFEAKIKRRIY